VEHLVLWRDPEKPVVAGRSALGEDPWSGVDVLGRA
jgi:hypothetical protein